MLDFVAVSMNLSCSTAMLISPILRVSYASHPTRCLIKERREYTTGVSHVHFSLRLVLARLKGDCAAAPVPTPGREVARVSWRACARPLRFSNL